MAAGRPPVEASWQSALVSAPKASGLRQVGVSAETGCRVPTGPHKTSGFGSLQAGGVLGRLPRVEILLAEAQRRCRSMRDECVMCCTLMWQPPGLGNPWPRSLRAARLALVYHE